MTNLRYLIFISFSVLFLYCINLYLDKINKENFNDYHKYTDLTPNITQNICPPNPNTTYKFKLNKNYCTSNLFCPNKTDLCVNNHCVPGDLPVPSSILENCNGCPKPGLVLSHTSA